LQALQAVYPDYKPTAKYQGYWKDKANQKKFFDQLAIKWNIQKPEDWSKVTKKMVVMEGGSFINYHYRGFLHLGTVYIYKGPCKGDSIGNPVTTL
jgi:hypothetical protein